MKEIKILGISGSLRKGSFNTKLVKYLQKIMPRGVTMEVVTLEEIPLYDEDLENAEPKGVADLREKIKNADGLILVSPEYNYSVGGIMKNTIDWMSRNGNAFENKKVGLSGASTGGFGTVRGQMHLRQIMFALDVQTSNLESYLSRAQTKFNEAGDIIDETDKTNLHKFIEEFTKWVAE